MKSQIELFFEQAHKIMDETKKAALAMLDGELTSLSHSLSLSLSLSLKPA